MIPTRRDTLNLDNKEEQEENCDRVSARITTLEGEDYMKESGEDDTEDENHLIRRHTDTDTDTLLGMRC